MAGRRYDVQEGEPAPAGSTLEQALPFRSPAPRWRRPDLAGTIRVLWTMWGASAYRVASMEWDTTDDDIAVGARLNARKDCS